MIQRVHLAVEARSEQDFKLLGQLLDALGLGSDDIEESTGARLQSFFPSVAQLDVEFAKTSPHHAQVELVVSDPDSAREIVKRLGFKIIKGGSGLEPGEARGFGVRLPGGTTVGIAPVPVKERRALEFSSFGGQLSGKSHRFAIVASRFNSFIVERLLSGALDALARCGVDQREAIHVVRVPGSFEIPVVARTLAETGQYNAIICLGCLLRGDTSHYDVIAREVVRGIGQSAQETGVPHALGVLTCDSLEQAIDRAGLKMGNKGFEAALAALEMANLKKAVGRPARARKGSGIKKARVKSRAPQKRGKH